MDLASLFASMGVPPPNPSTCETPGLNSNWIIIIIALVIIFFLRKDSIGMPSYGNCPSTYCCSKKHHKGHHKHGNAYVPPYEPYNYGLPNNIAPLILVVLFLLLLLQKKPNMVPM